MSDIIITLHPDNDESINLFPNIKKGNIPNKAIDMNKLDEQLINLLNGLNGLSQPKYYSTLPTSNVGLVLYTDGYLYSWDGTQYVNTNIMYQAVQIANNSITSSKYVKGSLIPEKTSFLYDENNLYDFSDINDIELNTNDQHLIDDFGFEANTQYTFSCNSTFISTTGSSNILVYFRFHYTDGTSTGFTSVLVNQSSNNTYKTFTSEANKTIDYIYVTFGANITYKLTQLRLNKGTTDLGYNFKTIYLKFDGSNLLDKSVGAFKTNFLDTPNLYNFEGIEDSNISASTNICNDFNFEENTQYTFSCDSTYISHSGSNNIVAYLKFYYTDGTSTGWTNQICLVGFNKAYKTYTSEANKTIKYINITISGGIVFKMNNIRLNKGTTDLGYKFTFNDIINVKGLRKEIYIGTNKDFTTITEGFLYAYEIGNCDVYIEGEEFDLVNEYALLPSAYYQGIPVGKNNKYIFSSKSKLTFNYTGDDTSIMENYSPFMSNVGRGDFEIYNLNIECSRCRYCVHDENGSGTYDTPYIHKYINCNMKIDNTNNPNTSLYHCIGGGLGVNGTVEIKNCYFNSVYVGTGGGDVAYHGNFSSETLATNGKCKLFIEGNYFEHKMEFNPPHPELDKTYVLFNNNSISSDITFNTDYWNVKKWNNEIRS